MNKYFSKKERDLLLKKVNQALKKHTKLSHLYNHSKDGSIEEEKTIPCMEKTEEFHI